jgi:hypothetical protein
MSWWTAEHKRVQIFFELELPEPYDFWAAKDVAQTALKVRSLHVHRLDQHPGAGIPAFCRVTVKTTYPREQSLDIPVFWKGSL